MFTERSATNMAPRIASLPVGTALTLIAYGLSMTTLNAQDHQRPLSDFLTAQGSTQCFTPPAPAQLGWGTGPNKTNGSANLTPTRFALVDYTGLEARDLKIFHGIDLGTTVAGSVSERPLADGRALVTVVLETHNAMGWALQNPNDVNADPLAFGARFQDVVAGKQPALGDSHFHIQFTNSGPGAPLPDLICLNAQFCTNDPRVKACPTGFEVDFLQEIATINGALHLPLAPEGTAGQLKVTQNGFTNPAVGKKAGGPLSDGFPVEAIDLKTTGE